MPTKPARAGTAVLLLFLSYVAPAGASRDQPEIVIPPLEVYKVGEVRLFTLEGGESFHETRRALDNLCLVRVPESRTLLILWEEREPQLGAVRCYAISQDGRSVSRCEKTCYDLWLRYAHFDPAQAEPAISPELMAPDGRRDFHNNVENVFIENPDAGNWTVRVRLRSLVEDGHRETPEWDADFALVVTTVPP